MIIESVNIAIFIATLTTDSARIDIILHIRHGFKNDSNFQKRCQTKKKKAQKTSSIGLFAGNFLTGKWEFSFFGGGKLTILSWYSRCVKTCEWVSEVKVSGLIGTCKQFNYFLSVNYLFLCKLPNHLLRSVLGEGRVEVLVTWYLTFRWFLRPYEFLRVLTFHFHNRV